MKEKRYKFKRGDWARVIKTNLPVLIASDEKYGYVNVFYNFTTQQTRINVKDLRYVFKC